MQESLENELAGLTSVELVARMYRGAIDFVDRARECEGAEDRRHWLGRAVSVVDGLKQNLDHEAGGEIATNLDDLYEFVQNRLLAAYGDGFEASSAEAVRILEELLVGWDELACRPAQAG